jgi:hypothetical protein
VDVAGQASGAIRIRYELPGLTKKPHKRGPQPSLTCLDQSIPEKATNVVTFRTLRDRNHALAFDPTGNVPMQGLAVGVGMIIVLEASHKQYMSCSFFWHFSCRMCISPQISSLPLLLSRNPSDEKKTGCAHPAIGFFKVFI